MQVYQVISASLITNHQLMCRALFTCCVNDTRV